MLTTAQRGGGQDSASYATILTTPDDGGDGDGGAVGAYTVLTTAWEDGAADDGNGGYATVLTTSRNADAADYADLDGFGADVDMGVGVGASGGYKSVPGASTRHFDL